MNVMIVEDERIISLFLEQTILRLGHRVTGCYPSAESALKGIGSFRPDLVLLDIQLEGRFDGVETGKRIKRQFGIPIVYTTAFVDETTRARASRTGPVAFIQKPMTARTLKDLLDGISPGSPAAGKTDLP